MPIGNFGEDIYAERVLKYGLPVLQYCALRYNLLKQIEDGVSKEQSIKLLKQFDDWFGDTYKEVIADYVGQNGADIAYDNLYAFLKDRANIPLKYEDVVTPNIMYDYFDYLVINAENNPMGGLLVFDMYKRADDNIKRMLSTYITPKYLAGLLKFLRKKGIGFSIKDFDGNMIREFPPADPKNYATVYVDTFNINKFGDVINNA